MRKSSFTVMLLVFGLMFLLPVQGAASNTVLTKPGTFPIVKQKITISVAIPASTDPLIRFDKDNYFTKLLEDKTNIHIKWQTLNASSFKEQLYLMFAGGELADMVVTGVTSTNRISKSEEVQFGSQGQLIPLNKLIEKQSVWFKKVLKEQKGLKSFITTPNGNIYALPNIDDGYHVAYPYKMWINTTWLKNLGLKMPATTEEFYEVLKAFRDKDPNRNGKKDEIPLSTCKEGNGIDLDGFLMNAFTYAPGRDRLWVKNGKVVMSAVDPQYKEGLKYLRRLYREGLIYKESFTQDSKSQVNLNESGNEPVIGAFPSLHLGYGCSLTASNLSNKWHQYEAVPPLKGPKGVRYAAYYPYEKFTTGLVSITRACKNPEAAFRMVDWLYSEEGTIKSMVGRENKEWAKADATDKGLDGRPAKWKWLNVDSREPEYNNKAWGQLFANYRPAYYQFAWGFPQNPYDPSVNPMVGRMRVFYLASKQYEKYAPKMSNVLPPLYYQANNIAELNQLKTTINDYIKESLVQFIVGNKDIDKDWPAFLSRLDQLGLKRYLQLQQESYKK